MSSTIICQICNKEIHRRGFHLHLKSHQITCQEYSKEFNDISIIKEKPKTHFIKHETVCLICNKKFNSEKLLSYHIRLNHKLDKLDYIKQYVFKNVIQLCKCGCQERVSLLKQPPYRVDYISGHNPNGMIGKHHSNETKQLQSQKAILRIEKDKLNNIKSPWHSDEIIEARTLFAIKQKDDERSILNNITFNHTIDERRNNIYKYKCNKCNTQYIQFHNSYFKCEKCYPRVKSQMQNDLTDFIRTIYTNTIISNTRKIITPYELDIYLPKDKLAIEFNGLYHHSKADKDYHLMKTNMCESQGIRLIHIFEDEWVQKRKIVERKLLSILNSKSNSIYARKCIIKEISFIDKTNFLNNNHIQGTCNSKINIGLYYNNELVSIMTFSLLRDALGNKDKNPTEFELVRYATSQSVIGGASKLLTYFIKTYNPTKIVSYADRRWSTILKSNLYDILKFKLIRKTIPNYWYISKGKRIHRFNFTKQKLIKMGFDKNKTEQQIMQENGYEIIYDCGHLKYELIC